VESAAHSAAIISTVPDRFIDKGLLVCGILYLLLTIQEASP
jgi:hypothetical protein